MDVRHHPDAVFIDELSTAAINSLLHEIGKKEFHAGIIFHENFEKLKKEFFKHFKLVKACGGLVKNKTGEVLLIFRRGKWDLPKGKLDDGETLLGMRFKRSTGRNWASGNRNHGEEIDTTYHTYLQFGKHILKESHWYMMLAKGNEAFKPQFEEDITEIRWVKKIDLKNYLDNTFPTIISVLKNA